MSYHHILCAHIQNVRFAKMLATGRNDHFWLLSPDANSQEKKITMAVALFEDFLPWPFYTDVEKLTARLRL